MTQRPGRAVEPPPLTPGTPAYQTIEAYVRALIAGGAGREAPLPADHELAKLFGVSRMTVRQAFARLVQSGDVVRHKGRGTFVSEPVFEEMPVFGVLGPTEYRVGDQAYRKRVVTYDVRGAPPDVAHRFGLRAGAKLTYCKLERLVDDRLVCIDERYLPRPVHATIAADELERDFISKALRAHGFPFSNVSIEVSAHIASPAEEAALGIGGPSALIERRVSFIADDDSLVAFGRAIYPAEHYAYRVLVRNVET
jgi:GntR family transcriptional regulator